MAGFKPRHPPDLVQQVALCRLAFQLELRPYKEQGVAEALYEMCVARKGKTCPTAWKRKPPRAVREGPFPPRGLILRGRVGI